MYPTPISAAIALAHTESAGYSCSKTAFTLGYDRWPRPSREIPAVRRGQRWVLYRFV
jgi:hypothetical protein